MTVPLFTFGHSINRVSTYQSINLSTYDLLFPFRQPISFFSGISLEDDQRFSCPSGIPLADDYLFYFLPGIALTDAVILSIGEIVIFLPRGLDNYYLLYEATPRSLMTRYVVAMEYTHFSWLYACSEIVIYTNTW